MMWFVKGRNAEFVLQPAESITSKCWVNIPEEHTRCMSILYGEEQVQEVLIHLCKSTQSPEFKILSLSKVTIISEILV